MAMHWHEADDDRNELDLAVGCAPSGSKPTSPQHKRWDQVLGTSGQQSLVQPARRRMITGDHMQSG